MKVLRIGDTGPQVQLLQLALRREGSFTGNTSGVFGQQTQTALRAFQRRVGLTPDGIAGPRTHAALEAYYTGYAVHRVRPGDTLYRIAMTYGSTLRSITTANPGLDPLALRVGQNITVPLNFAVTPTTIDYCSELIGFVCRGLAARYPFITLGEIGRSVMGKPLWSLTLGSGENRVLYNASHHANEWITTPVLLRFCEELATAWVRDGEIFGEDAREILADTTLCIIPAVDIDAIDLVTGDLRSGEYYERAADISRDYPDIAFPSGWKANIEGVDLNLQYPAGWEQAREIKFAQGFTSPAPRDYVGTAALSAPESRAMYDFTLAFNPSLTLSYHTQGDTIFWKYLDMEPAGSRAIAEAMGEASGYFVEETPYASGFAGYKDWFIQNYDRPGYTIEAGRGVNPLPISDFEGIYNDNIGILVLGMKLSAENQ